MPDSGNEFRFEGRVAIVTGAGGNPGLGRSYAMMLAAHGARVVVNDLGVGPDGRGVQRAHADTVAGEIVAAGGEAVADTNSVADEDGARAVVRTALDAWGTVDILINNAGVFHAARFDEISAGDLTRIVQVHLFGNIWMCRAAWPVMKGQGYGRIVNVSSNSMLGLPDTVIYGAAKAGIYGLTRGLAMEGEELGIKVNAFAPFARTVSSNHIYDEITIPGFEGADLSPDRVAPMVGYLAHEDCAFSGKFINAAPGHASETYFAETAGYAGALSGPEDALDHISQVLDRDGSHDIPDPGAMPSGVVLKPKPYVPDPAPAAG